MKQIKRRKKWRLLILSVVSLAILGCIGLHLSFVLYFNNKIKLDLQKEFAIQTDGAYKMVIGELKTNIFNQSVFISGFNVTPVKAIRPSTSKYHISFTEINLVDFKLRDFLLRDHLRFRSVELVNPKVTIFRNKVDEEPDSTPAQKGKFSIYRLLKKYVNAFSINIIQVSNAEIKVYANDEDSLLLIKSTQNEINIKGLRIDAESERVGRLFQAEKTELIINKFSFSTNDGLYTIRAARLMASYTDSSVSMDSVQLIPNYSKQEFARAAGEQTDRISITTEKIAFSKMDVKLFFEKNWFIAKQLKITKLNMNAYRDKHDKRQPKTILSVQALILKIPIRIRIDSILVNNAECIYEEVAEDGREAGKISFNNVDALITGFNNKYNLIESKDVLTVNASCRLMNKGKLIVQYIFPYNARGMVFDCSGKLYKMPMMELNKVLQPLTKVVITAGEVDYMIFSFHAGDFASEGTMEFVYHGLKIQMLENKNAEQNIREKFLSFLANKFVIKDQNPTGNNPIRITRIHYVRNKERFIFNYSLKSLLSGIKTTIGLPDKQKK